MINEGVFDWKVIVAEWNTLAWVGLDSILKGPRVSKILGELNGDNLLRSISLDDTIDIVKDSALDTQWKVLLLLWDIWWQEITEKVIRYCDEVTRMVDVLLFILPFSAYSCVNDEVAWIISKLNNSRLVLPWWETLWLKTWDRLYSFFKWAIDYKS